MTLEESEILRVFEKIEADLTSIAKSLDKIAVGLDKDFKELKTQEERIADRKDAYEEEIFPLTYEKIEELGIINTPLEGPNSPK